MKFLFPIALALCTATVVFAVEREEKTKAVIHPSAEGWDLKTGEDRTTIVVSPKGNKTNIGETSYPDWATTTLLRIDSNKRQYLVIYTPPMASGGSEMTILDITRGEVKEEKKVHHHYEFGFPKGDAKDCVVSIPDHQIELTRLIFPTPDDRLALKITKTYQR